MYIKTVKITLRLFDAFSLKDKRSVIKSIIQKTHNKFNVSIAEVDAQDMLNKAVIGIAIVSNSSLFNEQCFDKIISFIEDSYEVELIDAEDYL